MIKTLHKKYKGLVLVTGPIKSGKSKLAEYLIKDQNSVIYIATSKIRHNDKLWQEKIIIHKKRRPLDWKLIEYPQNICNTINSLDVKDSVIIDSLGGLVEQHLNDTEKEWKIFTNQLYKCLGSNKRLILLVSEEVGWGVVPSTLFI